MSDLLRLLTCGSVDDGKSTLLGRLLYEVGALTEDQLGEIQGADAEGPDFSLALDGLEAEREQGITIDVAYRSLPMPGRRLLIADVPGHEQYTRNMVTAASLADAALLIVDARKGILAQTSRHFYLAWLLGIRHFILVVNKMDAVNFSEKLFRGLAAEFDQLLARLGAAERYIIPISAKYGDNVARRSIQMPWYPGGLLVEALSALHVQDARESRPFRFPVQWVNRTGDNLRGYSGLITAGTVAVGDQVTIEPSEQSARVGEIVTFDGRIERAVAGQSVTLMLDQPVDVARGHIICASVLPCSSADLLHATVIWMAETPLLRRRSYRLKVGTKSVFAQVTEIRDKIDIEKFAPVTADTLQLNEVGSCTFLLDEPIAFDSYDLSRDTGGFILIDRVSNDTVGAGLIRSAELQARDVPWQAVEVSKSSRGLLKKHPAAVLWFTGLSGAGKSTLANLVEKILHAQGRHTYLLDGDNLRHGLNRDLGFHKTDRVENVRRVSEVARLMADAGLIVLVALISPFRAERRAAREMLPEGEFIEIFVDTPLEVAEARDVKGLYRKARSGKLSEFTGIDSPYEIPENPELHIDTTKLTKEAAAEAIVAYVEEALFGKD